MAGSPFGWVNRSTQPRSAPPGRTGFGFANLEASAAACAFPCRRQHRSRTLDDVRLDVHRIPVFRRNCAARLVMENGRDPVPQSAGTRPEPTRHPPQQTGHGAVPDPHQFAKNGYRSGSWRQYEGDVTSQSGTSLIRSSVKTPRAGRGELRARSWGHWVPPSLWEAHMRAPCQLCVGYVPAARRLRALGWSDKRCLRTAENAV